MFSAAIKSAAAAVAAAVDPYFRYVTMLLHGDGTNGGQNNTLLDSSTNNFTITRNGNTTQGSFSPYGANWSNYFSGSVDCFAVLDNAAFNLSSGAFTIECWINTTVLSGYQTILSKRAAIWEIGLSNNTLYWWVGSTVYTTTITVTPAAWTHFAVSSDGTNIKLFVNGVLDRTVTGANPGSGAGNVFICSAGNGTQYYAGYLSNLRVVKGTALYTSNFTPSTTPLTAVSGTSLLTCQSNRFIDNSSNNFAITVTGTPSVQRFSPFAPSAAYSTATIGGSGYFDGSGDYLTIPDNAAWNMGSGDFTAEAWIYPTSFANEAMIMGQWSGDVGGTTLNWALMFSSGSTGYLRLITSSNGSSVLFDLSTSTFALTLNMWQHIAAVRSGSTFTVYVNGVSRATTTNASALYDATNNFTIGAESNSQTQYFAGYISNARVVKGTAVYTAAFTPPVSPVTAISGTSLLFDCTNAAIYDNAMMNDLETVGNAQISTSVVKYGTGSISINSASAASYLTSFNADAIRFGTGDLTIEGWIYPTQYTSDSLICKFITGANVFFLMINSGQLCIVTNGYSPGLGYSYFGSINLNTWTYIAVTRVSGTWYGYINGTKSASSYSFATSMVPTKVIVGEDATNRYIGYIDDFRITKGVARYTASFTAPTAAFPNN